MRKLILLLIVVAILGCNHSDDPSVSESSVAGVWFLSERGYSPGAGYIVEPVNEDPPSTMSFLPNGEFKSTVQGMDQYKFYTTKTDQNERLTLSLFKSPPDPLSPEESRKEFWIAFEDNILKLIPSYPGICIEGCHYGFKRFNGSHE